ncbi:MAG: DNA starvation/stationary phase protection protein [Proteobacteria bacterium]|nr:DNA starvation/stationary phase protection protein [Burkholderiales bacterium]
MKVNIGLKDGARASVIGILNKLLADEFVLYTKTRRFHWNVVGPDFSELHKFFEAQYEAIEAFIDDVAERARALDGTASGSLKEFLALTRLEEKSGTNPQAQGMIEALLGDHETIVRNLRADLDEVGEKHGDAGTNDFLTGLMEQHEKMAWMLRAYLR